MARSGAPSASTLSADTRIALLVGKELFLQTEHTARIRAALKERFGEVDTVRFDGQTASAADVLDECRSFGLMQQHKLVVVDDADLLIRGGGKDKDDDGEGSEDEGSSGSATRPMFERYAQAPTEGATLVLRAKKFVPGKLGPLIEKVGAVIKCEAESADTARRWLLARAPARHGVQVDPRAADLLIDRIGPDLGRLDTEVAKLAASIGAPLTGKGKKEGLPVITADAAGDLVGVTREEEMWSIQDAMVAGDPAESLRHLHAILDRSGKDQSIGVLWACIDLAKKLHAFSRGLRQGQNAWTLGKQLRVWPDSRAESIAALAKRLDPRAAAGLLAAAVEADRRSKSGLGHAERQLEVLALRFASAGA